jgi:hypothetical protein
MNWLTELPSARQLWIDHITAALIILVGLIYVARLVWLARGTGRDKS